MQMCHMMVSYRTIMTLHLSQACNKSSEGSCKVLAPISGNKLLVLAAQENRLTCLTTTCCCNSVVSTALLLPKLPKLHHIDCKQVPMFR